MEHDWWATGVGYSMVPRRETHAFDASEVVEEMVMLFHVARAHAHVDPHGKAERFAYVFTKLEMARNHCEKVGQGRDFVDQFIR